MFKFWNKLYIRNAVEEETLKLIYVSHTSKTCSLKVISLNTGSVSVFDCGLSCEVSCGKFYYSIPAALESFRFCVLKL